MIRACIIVSFIVNTCTNIQVYKECKNELSKKPGVLQEDPLLKVKEINRSKDVVQIVGKYNSVITKGHKKFFICESEKVKSKRVTKVYYTLPIINKKY